MFQLTKAETDEWERLRSQFVTLKKSRGTPIKYQPNNPKQRNFFASISTAAVLTNRTTFFGEPSHD
jgi:hypothetical protein